MRRTRGWHANLAKRQVKAPKVYVRDSGLLHVLLGIGGTRALETHPKVGASWEGFALECVIERIGARPEECYFWASHAGAEVDLFVARGRRRVAFEFKRTTAPHPTRSMHTAIADLGLRELCVVHAGQRSFQLTPRIRAVALQSLLEDLRPLPSAGGR